MSAADDEDMGDFWRSVRAERQQKRADNRADSAAMLLAAGLKGYEAGSAAAAHAAWQPIATAPKDGTFVLTWRDHRGGEVLQARYAPTMFGDVCWGGVGWSLPKSCEPSHWMPLPAAPTQGAEGAAPQAEEVGEVERVMGTWRRRANVLGFSSVSDALDHLAALTPSPTPTAPQEADALREALKGTVAAIESMYGRKPEHVEAALANAKHALLAAPAQHQPSTSPRPSWKPNDHRSPGTSERDPPSRQ